MAEEHLYGSCSCERNQYIITIHPTASSNARVFFDNSSVSSKSPIYIISTDTVQHTDTGRPGRAQAAPLAAWLRVPLDWYSSTTYAYYDNESHSSIKKTYHTPSTQPNLPPTRRQFCGYCGTTLTAWNEATHSRGYGNNSSDYLDVTLGSLLNESLDKLETLSILPSEPDSEEEELQGTAAAVREASLEEPQQESGVSVPVRTSRQSLHRMNDRGVPYFEELIENSRLGRIRRQVGGHTSPDGSSSVRWEVIETVMGGGDDQRSSGNGSSPNKRQRLDL